MMAPQLRQHYTSRCRHCPGIVHSKTFGNRVDTAIQRNEKRFLGFLNMHTENQACKSHTNQSCNLSRQFPIYLVGHRRYLSEELHSMHVYAENCVAVAQAVGYGTGVAEKGCKPDVFWCSSEIVFPSCASSGVDRQEV